MADIPSGLTPDQAAAVAGVLNLASAELRDTISAAINSALASDVGGPFSDEAILGAIGAALARYSVS